LTLFTDDPIEPEFGDSASNFTMASSMGEKAPIEVAGTATGGVPDWEDDVEAGGVPTWEDDVVDAGPAWEDDVEATGSLGVAPCPEEGEQAAKNPSTHKKVAAPEVGPRDETCSLQNRFEDMRNATTPQLPARTP
jgi:hypothetical protein